MASFPVLPAWRRLPTVLAVLVYGVGFLVGFPLIRGLTFGRLCSKLMPTAAKDLIWEDLGDFPDHLTLAKRSDKPLVPTQIAARRSGAP